MKTAYTVAMSVFAGVALGGAAIQGLHAQAKPKAYVVSELETLDPAAQAVFTPPSCAKGCRWPHFHYWWGKGC